MMENRQQFIQEEVSGVHGETAAFFKYSALVATAATAGVYGVGMFVPAIGRLTPAKKLFGILLITPVPSYIWAEHQISRNALERARMRRKYQIHDTDIERAKEQFDKKPFFYRYRSEMTMGLAAVGFSSGVYLAYHSRGLTTQQKWVKTRMWFSTAGVGTALGLALLYAGSSRQQKEDMEETPYARYKKQSGL